MARNYNCAQAFLCLSGSGMETSTWLLLENLGLPSYISLCVIVLSANIWRMLFYSLILVTILRITNFPFCSFTETTNQHSHRN